MSLQSCSTTNSPSQNDAKIFLYTTETGNISSNKLDVCKLKQILQNQFNSQTLECSFSDVDWQWSEALYAASKPKNENSGKGECLLRDFQDFQDG